MPQAFDNCIAEGGKVITKRVNDEEYIKICYPKGGGSGIAGETHKYKKLSRAWQNMSEDEKKVHLKSKLKGVKRNS